jgi:hypothetical protein
MKYALGCDLLRHKTSVGLLDDNKVYSIHKHVHTMTRIARLLQDPEKVSPFQVNVSKENQKPVLQFL